MNDLSNRTACVVDHGLFLELALRLARDGFGKVFYHTPWEKGFPLLNDGIIGDGFEEEGVIRCDDIFDHLREIDLFVFPDVQHHSLQKHLALLDKPVWGSRRGDELELYRELLKKKQKELGMDVPEYAVVTGLTALREFLEDKENVFVKMSKFRGSHETWKWINSELSGGYIDELRVRFGGASEQIPFVVEFGIDTDIEVGYDGYCIDGKFPSIALTGLEKKDQGYIGVVTKYEDMPDQVVSVNEALADTLKAYRYRNLISTEIRVKDDKNYLIDLTCRFPSPSGEAQLELWGNLPEIMWQGAWGGMLDPEPTAQFCAEAIVQHNGDEKNWRVMDIPDSVRQWVKLYHCCKIDGRYHIPPADHLGETIGAVIGLGDTMEEAIDAMNEHAAEISHNQITINADSMVDILDEFHEAEKQGVPLTDQPVPKPETALDLE